MTFSYVINGLKIIFPIKAYDSQVAIMNAASKAIINSKNCLIESPTGTGKTLALLCSALEYAKNQNKLVTKEFFGHKHIKHPNINTSEHVKLDDEAIKDKVNNKITIYYCTRTHNQINQIVSELKRTKYCENGVNMTILSSRAHSCINSKVKQSFNPSSLCKAITKPDLPPVKHCKFYNPDKKSGNYENMYKFGLNQTWNLNELIEIGKIFEICPYFASKAFLKDADIVFAPYNYILNPLIARQMNIDLNNNIVIFDEAHNIEDACMGIMSAKITHAQFESCASELEVIVNGIREEDNAELRISLISLINLFSSVSNWVKSHGDTINESERSTINITGHEFEELLEKKLDIDLEGFKTFHEAYNKITTLYDQMRSIRGTNKLPEISESSQHLMASFFMILDSIIGSKNDHYAVSFSNTYISDEVTSQTSPNHGDIRSTSPYLGHQYPARFRSKQVSVNFICLSPALTFKRIKCARTIILASGTLSPMKSFAPELECEFDIKFQATNHLQNGQAAVYSLGVDSKKEPLRFTYKNRDLSSMQDEVGRIILQVCKIVPHGVLCFFPSYATMERLLNRWQETFLYHEIGRVKSIYADSKKMSASDSKCLIEDYFRSIYFKGLNGSILFSVCRGRISEGIDFADEKARAVIGVGIPYPNMGAVEIERKMLYNDKRMETKGKDDFVLSGNQWYKIQAYRALNQAMGRCIRHNNDWGAIILLDERFQDTYTKHYLSNWISKNIREHSSVEEFNTDLKDFVSSKSDTSLKIYAMDEPKEVLVPTEKEICQSTSTFKIDPLIGYPQSHLNGRLLDQERRIISRIDS